MTAESWLSPRKDTWCSRGPLQPDGGSPFTCWARAVVSRTSNIAERSAFSEREWIEEIGRRAGWSGSVIEVPGDSLPAALRQDLDFRQHWVVDSTKVRAELGYSEPTTPDAALAATVEWELAHPLQQLQMDYESEDRVVASL